MASLFDERVMYLMRGDIARVELCQRLVTALDEIEDLKKLIDSISPAVYDQPSSGGLR